MIRRVRQFLARIVSNTPTGNKQSPAPIFASVPSDVKEHSGEITIKVPILGFTALELYVIPDWYSLTIEGRVKQQRVFQGSNWTETMEKRITHRIHFDFELDPDNITATLNETIVEIIAHRALS